MKTYRNQTKHCQRYVSKLLQLIDVLFTPDEKICRTKINVMSKAYVLNVSDREKQVGSLRRKEKLSSS